LRRLRHAFDALYCITNMPISRYLDWLEESGNLEGYMERLVNAFNPSTISGLMCRDTISVGWDGRLRLRFRQMLDLEVGARRTISVTSTRRAQAGASSSGGTASAVRPGRDQAAVAV
jgi:hypothetical protein